MRHRIWAHLAAAWAILFAAPHLYWATGRTDLLDTALSRAVFEHAGWWFRLLNAGIAVFCLCGAATALATLSAWPRRWGTWPRRVLTVLAGFGALLLLARCVDIYVEFTLGLTGIRRVPVAHLQEYRHLARWFMFWWLPWFALGAVAWTGLAWTLARAPRDARASVAGRRGILTSR